VDKEKTSFLQDLISQAEAARLRGVSRAAIRDLIRRGRLTTVLIGGRELVYRSEIEGFQKEKPGPKTGRRKVRPYSAVSTPLLGRDYMIREENLEAVRERTPGRPRKVG